MEVVEERDVTDPSRVYTPREPGEVAQEREADAPELAGGGEAAGYGEVQTAEVVEEDPARAAAIAVAEVERAFSNPGHDQEIER
ncbi:hypothetical protein ACDI35_22335 (plasmid) [Xanthomonas axonopodis pv. cajani]|uniref:hypothetical protein n=1 Tax=Xanthomonas TaxID=338 RepID=UPI000AA8959A|nr:MULTISPECIES: hypothetical protein [Xanthomonas]MDM4802410.1 hypothetical protein [Xanthomonas phaseoli pv. phaseoli]MDM4806478.1 hypothetical protein [Xanthomonas phaseoli pv. phaseoli]